MNFFTYDPATGQILSTGFCPPDQIYLQSGLNIAALEGEADERSHYILDDEVTTRPDHTISIDKTTVEAFDKEIATITGVPSGATIWLDDEEYTADGTDLEVTFWEQGEHSVRVEDFPTMPFEVTVNAT
jgi:hypothetical protein